MPKTSIIIPICDNEGLTEDCLTSIRQHTSDYEIIIVDNGSKTPYTGSERVIRNNVNLGFPKSVNQGIAVSRGSVVVVLNNDTLVTPHWLEYLDKHLEKYDIVGPMTNRCSGPQQIPQGTMDPDLPLDDRAELFHAERQGQSDLFHRLVFFCVAIKRAVIDKIGGLDEQFSPGNFEDDDFCLRAIEAGFKLGIAKDVFIHHLGGATHKSLNLDYKKLLETNQAKFDVKWPKERYFEMQQQNIFNCK